MDIWIIQDGEKVGPLHEFQVREKIQQGELTAITPAWHERLNEWTTLENIGLFENEFAKKKAPTPKPLVNFQPKESYLIRRFWARWLDLYFYGGVWWLCFWVADYNIGTIIMQPWTMLLKFVPWFIIEAYLIHRFTTTPGKWLLSLRVINVDGTALSFKQSIIRAARVLFMGIGFGVEGLTIICPILSWITAKSLGRPLWDRAGGHEVVGEPIRHNRLISYSCWLVAAILLQWMVIAPDLKSFLVETYPQHKERFESIMIWNFHLEKRDLKRPATSQDDH